MWRNCEHERPEATSVKSSADRILLQDGILLQFLVSCVIVAFLLLHTTGLSTVSMRTAHNKQSQRIHHTAYHTRIFALNFRAGSSCLSDACAREAARAPPRANLRQAAVFVAAHGFVQLAYAYGATGERALLRALRQRAGHRGPRRRGRADSVRGALPERLSRQSGYRGAH